MALFADDVAWLCDQLRLVKPVIVGHSMGGCIALELAGRHSTVPSAVVMIDSMIFPPVEYAAGSDQLLTAVASVDYVAVCNGALKSLCLPSDPFGQRMQLTDTLHAPQHVILSSVRNHTTGAEAASACKLPIAYIAGSKPLAMLDEFKRLTPQLQIGTVLGVGHFCTLDAAVQVNAMIEQFIRLVSEPTKTNGSSL